MNGTTVEIALELEVVGTALAGRAVGADGETKEFVGWLGLVCAIDSFLPGTAAEPATTDCTAEGGAR